MRDTFSSKRFLLIVILLSTFTVLMVARLVDLVFVQKSFLLEQGDYESIHYQKIPAIRGMLLDRNGAPLAVSAPVEDILLDPSVLFLKPENIQKLAQIPWVKNDYPDLYQTLLPYAHTHYFLLKKSLIPSVANALKSLRIPGVFLNSHDITYYPMGEPMAQLIGFTDNNNKGQEGLELSLDKKLREKPGKEAILKTPEGNPIRIIKIMEPALSGETVTLSVDSRIQFIAYNALKREIEKVHAEGGSVIVANPFTGEILAAVSYPSFNPNDATQRNGEKVKNTAFTDTFEPGSTMKTFTIAAALLHGKYTPTTPIDTNPGWVVISGHPIHDDENNGLIDVTGVLKHSSNVGVSKIALSQPFNYTYDMIKSAGFSRLTGSQFPGESSGSMPAWANMSTLTLASISFGYHLSATTAQLARAYSTIANGGILHPLTFFKTEPLGEGTTVMPKAIANTLIEMLTTVTERGGTATLASIKGYSVVGKTGTTRMVGPNGYYKNRHNTMFVGIVPKNNPRLVIAIHITNPEKGWSGGGIAAPVFSEIASRCMRILGIPAES